MIVKAATLASEMYYIILLMGLSICEADNVFACNKLYDSRKSHTHTHGRKLPCFKFSRLNYHAIKLSCHSKIPKCRK